MRIFNRFKYKLDWMKVYFSPFKFIIPKLYIGKIAIGTPYFLPRRMVKSKKKQHYIFKKKYIGFDFIPMGWKTKWRIDDYRHEWNPIWSFVFFKWQIALIFEPEHDMHYWECWLNYTNETDKSKSCKERIKEAMRKFPCVWLSGVDTHEKRVCYWDYILKKKYGNTTD
jgi:hypothetical protein